MAQFIVYITEYDSEGEPQDSYKEWVESDQDKLTKEEAARLVPCHVNDIIQIIKK